MIVVSDTTPLIGLAVTSHFDLLGRIFSKIYSPQAVCNEAVVFGHTEGGARSEVSGSDRIEIM